MDNAEERARRRAQIAEEIATSGEVIDFLGVSRTRLNQYVKTGRIKPIIKGVYLRADIEAFEEAFLEARYNKKWLREFE